MKDRTPRVWLIDIRDEITGIRTLTKDVDVVTFSKSWIMTRAVERALLIIAEAAKHLPQPLKDTRPEVPWRKIHGLGNLLRHEYRHIDPEVLWSIITGPALRDLDIAAAAMLESLDNASKDKKDKM